MSIQNRPYGERQEYDAMLATETPVEERPHEELPIGEVPTSDWDQQAKRADEACRLIDRHLDYEARGRLLIDLDDFRPQHLCPEQRVQMTSDLYAATR